MKKATRTPRSRRSQSGETLVEVLIALLVVTLATLLLASMSTVSGSINLTARQNDERFYEALSKVEAMKDPTVTGKVVTIKDVTPGGAAAAETNVEVEIYETDGLAAYKTKD